jgi:hypothetical protein
VCASNERRKKKEIPSLASRSTREKKSENPQQLSALEVIDRLIC